MLYAKIGSQLFTFEGMSEETIAAMYAEQGKLIDFIDAAEHARLSEDARQAAAQARAAEAISTVESAAINAVVLEKEIKK